MWPAIIGAIGSIGGGLISSLGASQRNQSQIDANREAGQFSQEMAREQMAFQERMSSTAYQRGMADMKAAGLNPLLAYKQGGASTPGGAMGQMSPAQMENINTGLGEGVASAAQKAKDGMTAALADEQIKNTTSQTQLNTATESLNRALEIKAKADTAVSAEQQKRIAEETQLVKQSTINRAIEAGILGHNTTTAAGQARITTRQAEDNEKYGTSTLGTNLGGLERMGQRLLDAIKNRSSDTGGTTAVQRALDDANRGADRIGGFLTRAARRARDTFR